MFDRVSNPARGRDGGHSGAAGVVELVDGTPLKSKGKQLIKNGQRLKLSLPGGGGYGEPRERDPVRVKADLDAELISAAKAQADYNFSG